MRTLIFLLLLLLPGFAHAQNDDRSFLVGLLENNLSSPGRQVTINGFAGALSSQATIDEMLIADRDGVWLTLRGARLDWNRAALLRGRVEVKELSAREIIIARPPIPQEGIKAPPAAAPGFSLPDLPVSIRVDALRVDRVELGAPVLGQAAVMRLQASAMLANGAGEAALKLTRTDGKAASISFDGSFDNVSRQLSINLSVTEGAGGLFAGLTGLPGAPPLTLSVAGTGPLSAYSADLRLATDGRERLTGRVDLGTTEGDGTAAPAQTFHAVLGGDIAALVAPEYQAFFGPDIALDVAGTSQADGRLEISAVDLKTAALSLSGTVGIAADGLPDLLDLTGRIATPDGAPVLLPQPGDATRLDRADFRLQLGKGPQPEALNLSATIAGLSQKDITIANLRLGGTGTVTHGPAAVDLTLDYAATGLAPTDPALAQALGPEITGTAQVHWNQGATVQVPALRLAGRGYAFNLSSLSFAGLKAAAQISGRAEGRVDTLAQFSGLAGRPLGGAADLVIEGRYAPLSGEGTVDISLVGQNLGIGQPETDNLLKGRSEISISVLRDQTGTTLRTLAVDAQALTLRAKGALTPGAGDVSADLTFSDLSALGPSYGGALNASVRVIGAADGSQTITGTATGNNLKTGVTEVDGLIFGKTAINLAATRRGKVITVTTLSVDANTLTVRAAGTLGTRNYLTADLNFSDLSVMGGPYSGAVVARTRVADEGPAQRLHLTATGTDLTIGIPEIDRLLATGTEITLNALRADKVIRVDRATARAATLSVTAQGTINPGQSDLTAVLEFSEIAAMGGPYSGALRARAHLTEDGTAQIIAVTGTGTDLTIGIPEVDRLLSDGLGFAIEARRKDGVIHLDRATATAASLTLSTTGTVNPGQSILLTDLNFSDISALGPRYGGALEAKVRLHEDGATRHLSLTASADSLGIGQAQADTLLRGTSALAVDLTETAGRIDVTKADLSNPQLTATATAKLDGAERHADFSATLANLGTLALGLTGPLTVKGEVDGNPEGYTVALAANGAGGIAANINGTLAPDFSTANLAMTGDLQTGLANPFIAPRLIEGAARFDLRLNGAPGLAALAGRMTVPNARLVDPGSRIDLRNMTIVVDLGGGRADLNVKTAVGSGGNIMLTGPVTLRAPYDGNLKLVLDRVVLEDPELYRTELRGDVAINGPLTGGAMISGTIRLGDTELRVPSTGFGSAGALPDLQHVHEPAAVHATRARAGMLADGGSGDAKPVRPFGLDLLISAPRRIFVRGRGLDAEMGGDLRVTGTTTDIIPVGGFDLIRGRLDILGQRFALDSGSALLQGALIPYVRLSASTTTPDVTATITVEGPADDPKITFTSTPELPEEEVLAQILFGRDLSKISAFQALQLANAVRTLSGKQSEGVVSRLRQGFDLDDFDVTTDAEGNTGVRAGKYISKRLYSDVTVDATGRSELNLNIDVTKSLKARGSVANDGTTGLGIFFERDY